MGINHTTPDWLFWRAGPDAAAWGDECGRAVSRLFGSTVSGSGESNSVQVALDLPTADAARDAWNGNYNLVGMVTDHNAVLTYRQASETGDPASI